MTTIFKYSSKFIKGICPFLLLLLAQTVMAQDDLLRKIDPVFHRYLPAELVGDQVLNLPHFVDSIVVEKNGVSLYRCKVLTSNPHELANNSELEIGSVWPNFVTARLSIDQMLQLAQYEWVTHIEAAIKMELYNDFARGVTGVRSLHEGNLNNTTYDGSNVLVAIVDAGFGWNHGDFIDPASSTTSRIQYLWDQEITATGSEKTPFGNDATLTCCNFGVEYTNSEINTELATSNGDIRNADTHNHGTHVAGTAGGNGNELSPAQHVGMAPKSDLIFVNTDFTDASIIDALDYLDKRATDESKPIVVNLSLGSDFNAHDGTSLLAQAIDVFSTTSRVVVCAAGNEGQQNMHVSGTIAEGASSSFDITIPAYTTNSGTGNDRFDFLIYMENSDSVTCTVDGPNGSSTSCVVNSTTHVNTASDGAVYITNAVDARNGDRYYQIVIYDYLNTNPPAQGTYTITLNNVDASSPYSKTLTYHAWLYNRTNGSFEPDVGDNTYIVGSPASAKEAISVGAWCSRWRWHNYAGSSYSYSGTEESDDIAQFSSSGPLRDGTTKPEIAAPGKAVISSLSSFSTANTSRQVEGQKHYVNQGTSMACPVVTGAVALLFQINSSYSASDIKSLLTANATTDSYTGSVPNNTWGYGKLNALASAAKAINGSSTPAKEIIADDDWVSTSSVALSGSNKVAFKFTPSANGQLESIYFHTGSSSNSFSGDLTIGIYDDNSGEPGSLVGSSFTIDDALIEPYSWYQAINTTTLGLSSSTTYYAVIELASAGDSWSLLVENNSASSNTLVQSGGSWFTQSFDVRVRPVIASVSGVSFLPVELVYFNGKAIEVAGSQQVQLEWLTAMEENNSHFEVERASTPLSDRALTSPSDRTPTPLGQQSSSADSAQSTLAERSRSQWQVIGRVEGNGTSQEVHSYQFTDHSPSTMNHEPSTIYYRLKQVDYNGDFEYSKVIAVNLGKQEQSASFSVWPNPVNGDVLFVSVLGNYQLFDLTGQLVLCAEMTQHIDVSKLETGLYLLKNGKGQSRMVVKE
ncbi:MAG: S8 family peptidase [Bacteroidetes bacterium]|nr:S8 family peptidase [Bacteroidota bacterium]